MSVISDNVKDARELERQICLVKGYFDNRREVFKARQAKFLRMYPYFGKGRKPDIRKFEAAVSTANADQMNAILEGFEQERSYWRSLYVQEHCNCNIHAHIINTLDAMAAILAGHEDSYVQRLSERKPHFANSVGNNWGKAGEEAVDYVLKWLSDLYCVLDKDCKGKYSDHVILLDNPSFSDEVQEFDHLVIGPQGIFNIETKNYSGKLAIDKAGNWMRMRRGESDWNAEENPAQQLFRHHVLLQSIVGDQIPIIDVICMSHNNILITGQENSRIPVIKKDLLADFIVNYRPAVLTAEQIHALRDMINSFKVGK